MVKPFTPEDAKAEQQNQLPEQVISAVNSFLASRAGSTTIRIMQTEMVEKLEESGFNRATIFGNYLLDFEEAYRANGWKVIYDKPGYNETYDAFWDFTAE